MVENIDMRLLLTFFISICLSSCFFFGDCPPDPDTIVFEGRITNVPNQLDRLKIKIIGDDSIYVDSIIYKNTLNDKSFWYEFSINDYKKIHPKTIALQMEGYCGNGSVFFPKMDFFIDDCYYIYIGKEEYIKYKQQYSRVLENPDTPCGKIDDWFFSFGKIIQLGHRECEVPLN